MHNRKREATVRRVRGKEEKKRKKKGKILSSVCKKKRKKKGAQCIRPDCPTYISSRRDRNDTIGPQVS